MTTHTQKTQSMVRTTVSRCLVVGGALVLLSFLPQACSTHDILAVNIPNVIDPSQLNSPLGAAAAYAGAIGDFAFANDGDNGGTEGQILVSGVMTDEYIDSETFPTRLEYDSRCLTEENGTLTLVFRDMPRARVSHAADAGPPGQRRGVGQRRRGRGPGAPELQIRHHPHGVQQPRV